MYPLRSVRVSQVPRKVSVKMFSSLATASRRSVVATICAIALGLSACGADSNTEEVKEIYFGYALDEPLLTTNAGTNLGVSVNAQALAGRLYPSAHVPGPKGQLIPNSDFVNTQVLPGTSQRVIYNISNDAKYSDGKQVTCDSYLLAFTAGAMPDLFDSHLPLMEQVDRVECSPGSKQATVVFKEGFGARWRQLFGPGVLMPAHAIADKLGMTLEDFNAALQSRDAEAIAPIADLWKNGFSLDNFDPLLQVSTGPYKIEKVGDSGEVVLARNENYVGEPAELEKIVVWPKGADLAALAAGNSIQVVEATSVNGNDWFDRNATDNQFEISSQAGVLTEQLFLSNADVFADKSARAAFAACVDQAKIASVSSEYSGVPVDPVASRTVRASDPAASQMRDITDPHLAVNIEAAQLITGSTIRVGYAGPNDRLAAMVQAMNESCQPAGITVVDVSSEAGSLGNLSKLSYGQWGEVIYTAGTADAFIQAVDPMSEFASIAQTSTDLQAIRAAEAASWDEVSTIPLASQPRVFITHRGVENEVSNTDASGIGWNMNKWKFTPPTTDQDS